MNSDFEQFVTGIFRADVLLDNEHPLFWYSTRVGIHYPISLSELLERAKSDSYFSAYYGTSTMRAQADGKVFNRQSQFFRYFVVVLDDVGNGEGAKLRFSDLPAGLRSGYTYSVETSPGNYQLGYVLDEPISDLSVAKQLQRDVIISAGADSGGMLVNKAVRLPFGFNVKRGSDGSYKYSTDGRPFECRLKKWTGKYWSADALRLAAGVTGELAATAKTCGTTLLKKDDVHFIASKGIVDPVYEWLIKQNYVHSEGADWVTIECPWAHEHTNKNESAAGYSPLGLGEQPHRRGFHCFHDSCSGIGTQDFLTWVYQLSGIRASVFAGVAEMVSRYAFITAQNSAVDMLSGDYTIYQHAGFKNQYSGLLPVPAKKGKGMDRVSEYTLYMTDVNRMRLNNLTFLPGDDLLVERGADGYPDLNLYQKVFWPSIEYDIKRVQPFLDFIKYLCFHETDSDWLLKHIAAKAQNPKYRGLGVIMNTPQEGTGRGTLERVLRRLWSQKNVSVLTLSKLLDGVAAEINNRFLLVDWIFVPEAKDARMTTREEYRSYETLKSFIELGGVEVLIKEKWLTDIRPLCYASTIICSNHDDVVPSDSGDSRLKRINNTRNVWPEERWVAFYDWLKKPGWEPHVWSWLLQHNVGEHTTYVRSRRRTLHEEAINAILYEKPVLSAVILSVLYADARWGGVLKPAWCVSGMYGVAMQLKLDNINGWERVLKKELISKTYHTDSRVSVDGRRERVRTTADFKDMDCIEGFSKTVFETGLQKFVLAFIEAEGL